MGTHLKAVHIRTGERGAADVIDRWLDDHDVEIVHCADAFDACIHLVRDSGDAPELAFIGTDWLGPHEFEILRYLRETWPGTGVIIYGSAAGSNNGADPARTVVCSSRAALSELVARPPQEMAVSLGVILPAREPEEPPGELLEAQQTEEAAEARAEERGEGKDPSTDRGRVREAPPSESRPGAWDPAGAEPGRDESPAPRTILTREELSALLRGADG